MLDLKNIAVTHDWLLEYAGAERVLEELLHVLGKKTKVYTTVFDGKDLPFLQDHEVVESFISKLPFGRSHSHYRKYLPIMPLAVEQWDMSEYDIVISSNYAVAKGIICHPDQLHISYVHSPIRYAWDMQYQYLDEADLDKGIKGWIAKYLLHKIRLWDVRTANQVDNFIANSHFIKRRIAKVYRREAKVIYPPVDINGFKLNKDKDDFYCTVSRLVPYKKTSMIIRAFNQMPNKKLYVIGGGPDLEEMKKMAGPNVEVLGFQPQDKMVEYMRNARAFIYAAKEDFGIVPLEAQACGTPVIAFGEGGLSETVVPWLGNGQADVPTGILYNNQTAKDLVNAVTLFEGNQNVFDSEAIREHAEFFGPERFRYEIQGYIENSWESFQSSIV